MYHKFRIIALFTRNIYLFCNINGSTLSFLLFNNVNEEIQQHFDSSRNLKGVDMLITAAYPYIEVIIPNNSSTKFQQIGKIFFDNLRSQQGNQ